MGTVTVEAVTQRAERLLAARPDLTYATLAAHTPLSQSAVTHFFNGHSKAAPTAATARVIDGVLELIERGEILAPGGGAGVVVTEASETARRVARVKNAYITDTVRRIEKVLDYCAEECAIGLITGTYGAGKTEGVRIWRRKQRRVASLVFEFDEFSARNKVAFISALARELGAEVTAGPQFGGATFRAVCEALREKPLLLIFDQCESLSVPVCQVIRQIWDRTGVGVVLLAAPVLLARMESTQAKDLGALTSRVGIRGVLLGMTRVEMAKIVKDEGFEDVEETAFDAWYGACGGSMRRLMRSLDLLRAKGVKRVTEKVVGGVAEHLWGMTVGGRA